MDWYAGFIIAILLLWMASAPRDRNALRIVLIASLASEVIVNFITRDIQGAWKLAIPGGVEVLTILALLQWAPGRTGYLQATCLLFAWMAHLMCYMDIVFKTDTIYSRYETVIQLVAIAQIAVCYETLARCWGALAALADTVRRGGDRGVRTARMRNGVLPVGSDKVVSAGGRTQKGR